MHAFSIENNRATSNKNAFIQIGIPLPKGKYHSIDQMSLSDQENNPLAFSGSPLCLWPDLSIRWCLISIDVCLPKDKEIKVLVNKSHEMPLEPDRSSLYQEDSKNTLSIRTQSLEYLLNLQEFSPLSSLSSNTGGHTQILQKGQLNLTLADGDSLIFPINRVEVRNHFSSNHAQFDTVKVAGGLERSNGERLGNYEANLLFHHGTDRLSCEITLHNPTRAEHPAGIWDLGEATSILIKEFTFSVLTTNRSACCLRLSPSQPKHDYLIDYLSIYQENSGGENWQSPVHRNRENRVPFQRRGYVLSQGANREQGSRANPILGVTTDGGQVYCRLADFWQRFPSALSTEGNHLSVHFIPDEYPDLIELQPGEKYSRSFELSTNEDSLLDVEDDAFSVALNPEWINHCQALPFQLSNELQTDILSAIIHEGLSGENNFFVKREIIDEYGWRHFGDLYADHETDGKNLETTLVSHYNNQYDPLYGFLVQYLRTGKQEWTQLTNALAHHIVNIDIYHTTEDKDDYNGGLFWHTDHYLDAGLGTHRSFSKLQEKGVYMDHAGGGGPGGQHGYTSGLLYHYLLTGNDASKNAVIQLTDWLSRYYEGTDSILSALNSVKNHYRADIKNPFTGKYPLDRGTGNYINALMDSYTLTLKPSYLNKTADVIRDTVHPADDINSRDLKNIEESWYYTVFFQYLCRYLQIKEDKKELDGDFYFARDSLLHYAIWMVENEYFYLEKPELLEFPNHTWTAQEIRKVNVLYFAHYYCNGSDPAFAAKADELLAKMEDCFKNEPTRNYTRILAILMQNYGYIHHLKEKKADFTFEPFGCYEPPLAASRLQKTIFVAKSLLRRLFTLSISREISWLKRHTGLFTRG